MISVIVPTKNEVSFLYDILPNIDSDDVIVVDSPTGDGTQALCEEFKATYLTCDGDLSAAKNLGALKSKNEWLLFLDADQILWSDHPIQDIEDWLKGNPCMVATGPISQSPGTQTFNSTAREWLRDQFPMLSGGYTLIRKEVLCKLGGFKPRKDCFMMWEDLDLSMRCSLASYSVKNMPFATIHRRPFQIRGIDGSILGKWF